MNQLKELDPDQIVDTLGISAVELVDALEDYIVDWSEERDEI
ncbi:hypothetical protein N9Y23_10000 [Pseudomonadales bacterium]|nr:hypothetical protein [Pseudomonadales bacterium]